MATTPTSPERDRIAITWALSAVLPPAAFTVICVVIAMVSEPGGLLFLLWCAAMAAWVAGWVIFLGVSGRMD